MYLCLGVLRIRWADTCDVLNIGLRTCYIPTESYLFLCVIGWKFPFCDLSTWARVKGKICLELVVSDHFLPFFSHHIWFLLSVRLLVFLLCTCVFGYFGFFFFFFCWIFVSVLEFLVLPTISHGKSKDGIQPFKGPKPAARIANSLANRVYWAAYRGWHPPVPSTFPSLHRAPQLKPPNRTAYLKPSTRSRLSASLKNSRKN